MFEQPASAVGETLVHGRQRLRRDDTAANVRLVGHHDRRQPGVAQAPHLHRGVPDDLEVLERRGRVGAVVAHERLDQHPVAVEEDSARGHQSARPHRHVRHVPEVRPLRVDDAHAVDHDAAPHATERLRRRRGELGPIGEDEQRVGAVQGLGGVADDLDRHVDVAGAHHRVPGAHVSAVAEIADHAQGHGVLRRAGVPLVGQSPDREHGPRDCRKDVRVELAYAPTDDGGYCSRSACR